MIRIESSLGTILIHDDGIPYMSTLPNAYGDIAKFDVARLERMCNANHIAYPRKYGWDILALGYWLSNGFYESPADDYSEKGCMRHIWNGTVDDYDDAYELEYGEPLADY